MKMMDGVLGVLLWIFIFSLILTSVLFDNRINQRPTWADLRTALPESLTVWGKEGYQTTKIITGEKVFYLMDSKNNVTPVDSVVDYPNGVVLYYHTCLQNNESPLVEIEKRK